MSSIQAKLTFESLFSGEIAADQPASARRLKTLLVSIFGRRLRAPQHAVTGHEGCGWCDATERQILDDIAVSQARRAII